MALDLEFGCWFKDFSYHTKLLYFKEIELSKQQAGEMGWWGGVSETGKGD